MAQSVNLLDLQPGNRLRLLDGGIVEVVSNPEDGMWVICNYLSHPTNAGVVNSGEQPVFAHDIAAVIEPVSS